MMFRSSDSLQFCLSLPERLTTTGNSADITVNYQTTTTSLYVIIRDALQVPVFSGTFDVLSGTAGYTASINLAQAFVRIAPSILSANTAGTWTIQLYSTASPSVYSITTASAYWGKDYETLCSSVAAILTATNNTNLATPLSNIKAKTDLIGTSSVASTSDVTAVYNRVGAPAGASLAADVAAVKTDTGNTVSRLGTPASGTVATNVDAIKTKTDNLPTNTATTLGTLATSAALSFAQGDITVIKTATNSTNLATPLSNIKAKTDLIGASVASQTDTNNIYNRIGAPAGASLAADVAAVKSDTGNTVSRLGTPTPGNTVAAVVEATKTDTGNTVSRLGTPLTGTLATNIEGVAAKTNNLPIDTAALLGVPDSGTMSDVIDAIKAKLSGGGEIYDWLQMVSWVNGALDGSVLGSYDDAIGQFTLVQGATVLLTVQYYSDKEGTVIHVGPMGTAASRKVL